MTGKPLYVGSAEYAALGSSEGLSPALRRKRAAADLTTAREHLLSAAKELDPVGGDALHYLRLAIAQVDDSLIHLAETERWPADTEGLLERLDDSWSEYQDGENL